ncbi:carbohydrate kinase family protein [bacterium]|nr:carbohydrate kinase family protein [bacterium]
MQMQTDTTPRFLVIGTTTVDLTLTGFERLPSSDIDEFTEEGIALTDTPATMTLGGNGANSSFVLAGLGGDVSLCSVIGEDSLGDAAHRWLQDRGVGLEVLSRPSGTATSVTVIAMDDRMQRMALHHPGGAPAFGPADVPANALREATFVLLTSYHLLPRFRSEAAAETLATARRHGAVTSVDIGPAVPPVADLDELAVFLPEVSYLLANEHEMLHCSGQSDLEGAARAFFDSGAQALVVKRGRAGSTLITGDRRIDAATRPIEASSTVGAGDSFNAGFLFALGRGLAAEAALHYANAVAATVVGSLDGVMSSPESSTVEALLGQALNDLPG